MRGVFILSGISSPFLVCCSSCLLVGVFISVGSTSPSSGSSLSSFCDLLGSGVFSGSVLGSGWLPTP